MHAVTASFTSGHQHALDAVRALETSLNDGFVERQAEVRCLLIALLAQENLLLLGPPGTGKSALANALTNALTGSTYFGRLLTKFSTPEELFGPLSIRGLKDDRFERVIAGYLPTADVAFLDEVFKANSAILNALLTLVNEHIFDQGSIRTPVPLKILIGASNELPEEDEALDALRDRFMLSRWVGYATSKDSRRMLLRMHGNPAAKVSLSSDDLQAAREAADGVHIPEDVEDALLDVRDALAQNCGIEISDRRLRKCVNLIRANAAIEGRTIACRDDLLILIDSFWRKPDERPAVAGQITLIVAPAAAEALKVLDAANELFAKLDLVGVTLAKIGDVAKAKEELSRMTVMIRGMDPGARVQRIADQVQALEDDVSRAVAAAFSKRR